MLPPHMIDAVLQSSIAVATMSAGSADASSEAARGGGAAQVPYAIDEVWVRPDKVEQLWQHETCTCHVEIRQRESRMTVFDCSLLCAEGCVVMHMKGVYTTSIEAETKSESEVAATCHLTHEWTPSEAEVEAKAEGVSRRPSLSRYLLVGGEAVCREVEDSIRATFAESVGVGETSSEDEKVTAALAPTIHRNAELSMALQLHGAESLALACDMASSRAQSSASVDTYDVVIVSQEALQMDSAPLMSHLLRSWLVLLGELCGVSTRLLVVSAMAPREGEPPLGSGGLGAALQIQHLVSPSLSGLLVSAQLEYPRVSMVSMSVLGNQSDGERVE
jgi:hypothetical protein